VTTPLPRHEEQHGIENHTNHGSSSSSSSSTPAEHQTTDQQHQDASPSMTTSSPVEPVKHHSLSVTHTSTATAAATTTLWTSSVTTTTTTTRALPSTQSPPQAAKPVPLPAPQEPKGPTLSLPDDFERVERGRTWDTSPYVSQAHLDRLWVYLFGNYHLEVPPVPADGGPLPVGVGINFVKFKDFDEVAGTMNIALNLRLCWDDDRLSFSAEKFFNMSWTHEGDKVPIRSNLVWVPDVTVLNEVGGLPELMAVHTSPLVLADEAFRNTTGVNLLWSRPLDVRSNCEVDMTQYPFDEQTCYIVIGSWASSRRQMLLVPQPFFAEYTVHTSEFRVHNITVNKKDVYTKNTAQRFTQVVYRVVLQRYPHYYVINFILPMVAITLLTVATMWMSPGNVGPRVNSGTKLLLCVVSIIFITARRRPAVHGDIWMDRFQSHCLALSMSSVLESLFIDYLSKTMHTVTWAPRAEQVDSMLRACICWFATFIIFRDAYEVKRYSTLKLYTSFQSGSTRLLVLFIYIIFFGLIASSMGNVFWMMMPRRVQKRILGKEDVPDVDPELQMTPLTSSNGSVFHFTSPPNGELCSRSSIAERHRMVTHNSPRGSVPLLSSHAQMGSLEGRCVSRTGSDGL